MAEGSRPVFGSRYLNDPDQVFQHNAWDHVEWGAEQQSLAREKVRENSSELVPPHVRDEFEMKAPQHWDKFYQQHQNRFFKDRHWLFTEFPELKGLSADPSPDGKLTMLEVGCGVGNTVFPILQVNTNPNLFIYCCDFAESAIKIVKDHTLYDPKRCHAFQFDVTSCTPFPIAEGSLDLVVMIFVLSAISPKLYLDVICRLVQLLRPGGMLLFRDYGELDMAQLRFKKGQCLSEKFYVRGDGTRVYFFTEDEVDHLMSGAGLRKQQLYVDKRLQVNRGKQLKMYRVWIQAKYLKIEAPTTSPLDRERMSPDQEQLDQERMSPDPHEQQDSLSHKIGGRT